MIEHKEVTRHTPVCDNCGWRGSPGYGYRAHDRAVRDLELHKCGEHRATHGSGHFRGILGGYWDQCVCGEGWANLDGSPWKCPATDD